MPSPKKNAKPEATPAVEQPAVEQPAVEQPTVEQPTVEQPAVEESPYGRVVIGMTGADSVAAIKESGAIIADGKVTLPEGYDIMPFLRKHAEIAGENVAKAYETASNDDKARIDENLRIAFANNLKVIRFSKSTIKVSDVRAALRKTASARNAGLKKRAQKLLASLPADTFVTEYGEELFKTVKGSEILMNRESSFRGTEANGLVQLGLPQPDDQFAYLDSASFGIKFETTAKGSATTQKTVKTVENYGAFDL